MARKLVLIATLRFLRPISFACLSTDPFDQVFFLISHPPWDTMSERHSLSRTMLSVSMALTGYMPSTMVSIPKCSRLLRFKRRELMALIRILDVWAIGFRQSVTKGINAEIRKHSTRTKPHR